MDHSGTFGTIVLTSHDYWWPGMRNFIQLYVAGCTQCQQHKPNTHPTTSPPMLIKVAKDAHPFSTINANFITDLSPCKGFNSILVMANHNAMKGVILSATNKTADTLETSKLYHRNIFKHFSLPN